MIRASALRSRAASAALLAFIAGTSLGVVHRHVPTVAVGASSTSACTGQASVSYETMYSTRLPGYVLSRLPLQAGQACAGHAFEVTLADSLGHQTVVQGWLDGRGAATTHVRGVDLDVATVAVSVSIA